MREPAVAGADGKADWTAIVLAGQRPGTDPLAQAFGEHWKALVKVGGQPMLDRVLRTLLGSHSIRQVVVLAQRPESLLHGPLAWAASHDRIATCNSGDGIAASVAKVAGSGAAPWPVLITTADHPLLTPPMIEDFLSQCNEGDLCVGVVARHTLEQAHPQSRRTWLKFADGSYTGANLFAARSDRALPAFDLWSSAEQDRKHAWRLFLHFGPFLALRAVTRTIGLAHALRTAGKRLGLSARLVVLGHADAAVDVDKLADHALAQGILAAREDAGE
ncbi:nucleotidyltransferase family protein [Croceicoccus sp. F390]|uniref:Nucleotidyltransferase family protein n=1 Tax=Croceicoccus esteveae TaxID=3075597 RepID=A0ABU2ZFE7_9SPHN|nr:nucleotidyltransferase family protein [Croceicoccus sp. F390]MDT0575320.1 nucleotidyltransferase family protein [Croceicoccus sp. F390]